MDQPCSYGDLRECLQGIARVNRLFRAYRPTLDWLDGMFPVGVRQAHPVHILDVGCGYGDMLRRIDRWAGGRGLAVRLTGIDLNPDAVRVAREASVRGTITFVEGDAMDFAPPEGVDVVVSSLLTHHLEDCEVVRFLRWMEGTARLGWFVNDLHRQEVPYRLFALLARCTSWHPFVKHDGPVSILRSFRREDWETLCDAAEVPRGGYAFSEHRPARLCVGRVRQVLGNGFGCHL